MLIVTGADARCFAMTGILDQSLARWLPDVPLRVCDFGLTSAQRRFLETSGRLLPRPDSVAADLHPYFAKAALCDYLPGHDGPVIWFDSDMVAVAPLAERLTAILAAMRQSGAGSAACPDAEAASIDAFIARWSVAPFAAAARTLGLDHSRPYLNSGFFVCSMEVLRDVARHSRTLADHQMIDQNAFNLAAWAPGRRVAVLDTAAWNAHGRLLGRMVTADDGSVTCDGRRTLVLHATSIGGAHHDEQHGLLRGAAGDLPFVVKMLRNGDLARLQRDLLTGFAVRHGEALQAAGCFRPPAGR